MIDADEAKKVLPEYGNGIGANAVHEESSYLGNLVKFMALAQGANVVIRGGRQPWQHKTLD